MQSVLDSTEAQTNQRLFYVQTDVCGCKCFMKTNIQFYISSTFLFQFVTVYRPRGLLYSQDVRSKSL